MTTTVLSARVSQEERAILEAASEQAHTSLSEFVRRKAVDAAENGLLEPARSSRSRPRIGKRLKRGAANLRGKFQLSRNSRGAGSRHGSGDAAASACRECTTAAGSIAGGIH